MMSSRVGLIREQDLLGMRNRAEITFKGLVVHYGISIKFIRMHCQHETESRELVIGVVNKRYKHILDCL